MQTLNFWSSNDVNVAVLQEAVMPRYGYMDGNGNVQSRLIRQIDVKDGARTFVLHVAPNSSGTTACRSPPTTSYSRASIS